MMNDEVKEGHPTVRMFPRTLQEAFPKDYVNKDIFTGPYREPHLSDLGVLMALIAVFSFAVMVWRYV